MSNEIIYTCKSINNKNIRENELNILEKNEDGLFFVFGENRINAKKRYYNDLKTLNEDFNVLKKMQNEKQLEKIKAKNNKNSLSKQLDEEKINKNSL